MFILWTKYMYLMLSINMKNAIRKTEYTKKVQLTSLPDAATHTLNHSRSTDITIAHIQYKARQYANTDWYAIFNAGFTFFVSVKASLRFKNNAAIEVAPV